MPVSFWQNHVYSQIGIYNITVTANNTNKVINRTIQVNVIKCRDPIIRFSFGSKESPITYYRDSEIRLTASITWNPEPDCNAANENFKVSKLMITIHLLHSTLVESNPIPLHGAFFSARVNRCIDNYMLYLTKL